MGETARQLLAESHLAEPVGPTEPPRWAFGLTGTGLVPWFDGAQGVSLRVCSSGGFRLVSARVPGAAALSAGGLEVATRQAYEQIAERLAAQPAHHAVRVWNFIPGILAPLGDLNHRYMAFNMGRYSAYERWYEGRSSFDRTVPTASGVGHDGEDMVVHSLGALEPGQPVENPRQVPSYCYSRKYGPLPPCFARATLVVPSLNASPWLLVGGTASVRGEESIHPEELEPQADETLSNLAALVATGIATRSAGRSAAEARRQLLGRFRSVRVYHVRSRDRGWVRDMVADAFPQAGEVEMLQADLCRPRLLVEIEGVADLAT